MKIYNNGTGLVVVKVGGSTYSLAPAASQLVSNQYMSEALDQIKAMNASGASLSLDFSDDAGQILSFTSAASAGGSASETLTVTGLLASDTIVSVDQKTAGAGTGKTLISYGSAALNALPCTWSADPGAGAVVLVTVKR